MGFFDKLFRRAKATRWGDDAPSRTGTVARGTRFNTNPSLAQTYYLAEADPPLSIDCRAIEKCILFVTDTKGRSEKWLREALVDLMAQLEPTLSAEMSRLGIVQRVGFAPAFIAVGPLSAETMANIGSQTIRHLNGTYSMVIRFPVVSLDEGRTQSTVLVGIVYRDEEQRVTISARACAPK